MHEIVPEASSRSSMSKVTPECDLRTAVPRHLRNGDEYVGAFVNHAPHGFGTYKWRDGCVYEGDWKKGKATGKGKFTWPSGAYFHGEFRGGKMEGVGTFTGSSGDVYHGAWSGDRKCGYGVKLYANGDRYEGWWRRNARDGKGKYVWRNGNVYDGNWRNGVMSGNGALVWANGNRYEGDWDNGIPKNVGVLELGGRFQKICIWESDGENGDITCNVIDEKFKKPQRCFHGGDQGKKQGETISKGHKNYELMLHLQLGIRCSVSKHEHLRRGVRSSDFDPREKRWTRFPPEGSKTSPPHQSSDFWMKDYCPMVFRRLRERFQIDTADYMMAICGNEALREFSSPGKSGSFFYLTQDDRFMIKTVKKSEVKALIRMLHSYYHHVFRFEHSLVTKFFGVHCIKPVGGPKTRFIVMGNLLCSEYRIHSRFDLKGSSHGRSTEKLGGEIDETTTLKDNDLNIVFKLEDKLLLKLKKQIDKDCEFLEREKIMDYSLLVGVHFGGYGGTRGTGLGADVPAMAAPRGRMGEECKVVLYFGIIDILQDYDIIKKIEHVYKSLHADASLISAVDPKMYSRRFRDFVGRIFLEDDR